MRNVPASSKQDRKTEAEDKFKTAKKRAMEWMEELAVSWGKTEVHNGIALCSQNECLVYRVAEQTPRKTIKLYEEAITEKVLDPKLREEILTRASELQGAAGAHPVLEVIKRNKLGAKRAKIDDVTDDMTDTS
mmetsp:Transcript_45893/g.108254  ORF Transcript_45893/g.108254 Transcript_45893/m.108254 type:complete len:133 (+) Transcript_45893:309-707(+)